MPSFTLNNNRVPDLGLIKTGILTLFLGCLVSCGGGGGSGNNKPTLEEELDTFSIDTNGDDDPFTVDARGFFHHSEQSKTEGLTFLRQCVSTLDSSPDCSFSDTRLIRHTAELEGRSVPSVQDVMLHTIASHQWMLDRFEFALGKMPEDIRRLLGGVTSVVLGSHIRPSFYTGATGAIYIDAAYLWTTLEEKADVVKDRDFRSDFARKLQFIAFSRYYDHNGNSARSPGSINDEKTRTPDDIVLSLTMLLFHELAHSNDFFPPRLQDGFDRLTPVHRVSDSVRSEWVSVKLRDSYPLQSSLWKGLGLVMFRGKEATEQQKAMTAEEVGNEFESDLASDDYSYSHRESEDNPTFYEDTAMLFEEVMMRHHLKLDRIITFLEPVSETNSLGDTEEVYYVRWGQRNRAGDPRLRDRVRLLLDHYFPNQSPEVYLQSLVEPDFMPKDVTYGTAITQMYEPPAAQAVHTEKSRIRAPRFELSPEDIKKRHSSWHY